MLRLVTRFVMATRKASQLQGSHLGRPKLKGAILHSKKETELISSEKRPHSTQTSQEGTKSTGRKVNSSPSAGSVNPRRNIRQRSSSSSRITDLNKSFQRLSVKDQNKPPVKKFSSSSGSTCKSLEDVARLILKGRSKNIVVMAGAGISTPSGIPDFRTPGSGLYDNLQQYKIPYPEAIFDIMYFYNNPKPFFALAKELYPGNFRPNYVHYFVRMLYEKGYLLRMYTQNIDGLERLAGIPPDKLVEAHGTFSKASCIRCHQSHEGEEIKTMIMTDRIPRCKRQGCSGVVKPDIVFFGEDLPKRFFYYLKDLPQCDMVIIMGTSLEVYPFAGIVNSARGYIPRVLINREAVGPFARPSSGRFNDLAVTGDLLESVQKFARVLGWKKAMEDLIKENELLLDEKYSSTQIETNVESNSKPADERSSKSDQSEQNISQTQATESNNNNKTEVTPQQKGSLLERNSQKPTVRSFHSINATRAKNVKSKQVSLPNINRQTVGPRNTWKKYQVSSSSESSEETSSSDESDSSSDS